MMRIFSRVGQESHSEVLGGVISNEAAMWALTSRSLLTTPFWKRDQ